MPDFIEDRPAHESSIRAQLTRLESEVARLRAVNAELVERGERLIRYSAQEIGLLPEECVAGPIGEFRSAVAIAKSEGAAQ